MVTEIANENVFQSAFRASRESNPSAAWVELVRGSAIDRFELLGFPTVREEEWKYTSLAPWVKDGFSLGTDSSTSSTLSSASVARFSYPETSSSHVVVVNGFFRQELSNLASVEAVVVTDLFGAISDARYSKIVREYLARNANYNDNSLTALNTAFLRSGVFILIPRNVKLEAPLQITYLSDAKEPNQSSFPRCLVVAQENSSARIIENFVSTDETRYFTNAVVEIVLEDNAKLEHYRLQNESLEALHVGNTAVELGRASSFDTTAINLGAKLSRHDISVLLDHAGAECWVDGLYVVGPNQHADTHSLIDHKQPHCNSHQLYKGILDGNGRAVFNGKVFVRHGAEKTDAMQTNKNLLLSANARVDTKPQLEIYADDVKCAHGAAVGQISQDELFYLQTRCIGPELGRSLLTYGFAEEVIGKIKIDSIRSKIDEAVLKQLKTRLEN